MWDIILSDWDKRILLDYFLFAVLFGVIAFFAKGSRERAEGKKWYE